jgi:hypothetical protein
LNTALKPGYPSKASCPFLILSAMPSYILKILEYERAQLLRLLSLIDETIEIYRNGGMLLPENDKDGMQESPNILQGKLELLQKYAYYNPALNNRSKVLFIIKTEKRFLHVREIARIAWQLENNRPFENYIKIISPALSMLKKTPGSGVVSIEVGKSHFNTFWGCGEWLTEMGGVKTEFMYNQAELSNHRRQMALSMTDAFMPFHFNQDNTT